MKAMRQAGGDNAISFMLSHLSEMLRIVMDAQTQLIPITEEVEHARHYVEIMRARYPDKIEVNWSLQPELFDLMITKISIQPLIENAIQHGLRARRRKGTIIVSGWLEEESIMIVVADNGAGLNAAEVERLNERIAAGYLFDKGTSVYLYIPKYTNIR